MTTRKQASDLRARIISKVREGTDLIHGVFELYSPEAVAAMMPALIMPILDQTSILTAEWYDSLNPQSRFRTKEYFPVSEGRINYTVGWAQGLNGPTRPVEHMSGAFQRMVFDCSRQTVIENAKREGVPFHRDAREEACDFCRLLTVDPDAHRGKYVDMPSHNHDCRCVAVVSRGENLYVPPAYVEKWKTEVEASKSASLTDTLAKMADAQV